jgi:hypothetical protein
METRHGITGPYWYGVDLDGTLARWCPNDQGMDPLKIGEPVPAMVRRVQRWLKEGRTVRIVTARMAVFDSQYPTPRSSISNPTAWEVELAIRNWTQKHIGTTLSATCCKDCWMVELWDDRAVEVEKDTGIPKAPYWDGREE